MIRPARSGDDDLHSGWHEPGRTQARRDSEAGTRKPPPRPRHRSPAALVSRSLSLHRRPSSVTRMPCSTVTDRVTGPARGAAIAVRL
jgi:hypothetical protein